MAKAASPVRFQQELMDSAAISGQVQHRSAVGQIEYWATIGRMLDDILEPETLLAVAAGFKRLSVETTEAPPIDADALFNQLDGQRKKRGRTQSGAGHQIAEGEVAYQSAVDHPGLLEQIRSNGERTVGQFENGVFIPIKGSK
jgi:hypothetical protein